jgi:hypothetical protein
MLVFGLGYTTEILQDAAVYSEHASRTSVQTADIRLAMESRAPQFLAAPPSRDVGVTAFFWAHSS